MSSSLSQKMHDETVARLVSQLKLAEVPGEGGGAYLPLESRLPMVKGSLGQMRVFRGPSIFQLVTCTIVVPPIQLDSHMLFAFADTRSAVPHFTLDSVRNGADYAFHLDLIPRLDLATALAYMDEVFAPLTPVFRKHREHPGLRPAQLDPRQYAVMSPWMFVSRADEAAFRATFGAVSAYLHHWLAVLGRGVSSAAECGTTPQERAARDQAHRAVLFNPEVDKVWNQIAPLVGADTVQKMIALLRTCA